MTSLALSYRDLGSLNKALPLFEETLKLRKAKLGLDHPHTLVTTGNLALGYVDARQLVKALPLLEEALKLSKPKLGPNHPVTLFCINNLATAYEASSQFEKAEFLRREQLALVKTKSGSDSSAYASALAQLCLNLLSQEKWMDVEPLLRECLAIREKNDPDDWRTFDAQSLLGGALFGQKNYTDAEPLLLKGYEGMKAREKTIPAGSVSRSTMPSNDSSSCTPRRTSRRT